MARVERTLAMIKPDAVRKGKDEEIMQIIESNGFAIVAKERVQLTQDRAEEFYAEHLGKPFFPTLVEFMTSGPIWALVLEKPDAIRAWRALMGPTNCFKAREEAPQSLRALFGTDGTQNATHGSDSPNSAAREIKFHFPNLPLPVVEKTLALIKPDAVMNGKAQEIKQLIELHGFTIITQAKLQLTRACAEEFYAEHRGKPFFGTLVDFMTSGPIWALVLARPNAIRCWRAVMGPTNCLKAKEEAPRSLRALYGTDGTRNACHGSDSPLSAAREIKFYFPQLILEPPLGPEDAKIYIAQQLQPALSKALTALAREKPSAEKYEAITFLANFLLNNNPNKPKIMTPDVWEAAKKAEDEEQDDEEEFANATLTVLEPDAAARDECANADGAPDAVPLDRSSSAVQRSTSIAQRSQSIAEGEDGSLDNIESAASRNQSMVQRNESSMQRNPSMMQRDQSMVQRNESSLQRDQSMAQRHQSTVQRDQSMVQRNQSTVQRDQSMVQRNESSVQRDQSMMQRDPSMVQRTQSTVQRGQSFSQREEADAQCSGSMVQRSTSIRVAPPAAVLSRVNSTHEMLPAPPAFMERSASVRSSTAPPAAADDSEPNAALLAPHDEAEEHEDAQVDQEHLDAAATMVQATFRGYQARKEVAKMKLGDAMDGTEEGAAQDKPLTPPAGAAVSVSRDAVLQLAFSQLDKDGSGFIDKEEFRAAMAEAGERFRAAEAAAQQLDAMDANGDNKVSLDEFMEHLMFFSSVLDDHDFNVMLLDVYHVHVPTAGSEHTLAIAMNDAAAAAVAESQPAAQGLSRQVSHQASAKLQQQGSMQAERQQSFKQGSTQGSRPPSADLPAVDDAAAAPAAEAEAAAAPASRHASRSASQHSTAQPVTEQQDPIDVVRQSASRSGSFAKAQEVKLTPEVELALSRPASMARSQQGDAAAESAAVGGLSQPTSRARSAHADDVSGPSSRPASAARQQEQEETHAEQAPEDTLPAATAAAAAADENQAAESVADEQAADRPAAVEQGAAEEQSGEPPLQGEDAPEPEGTPDAPEPEAEAAAEGGDAEAEGGLQPEDNAQEPADVADEAQAAAEGAGDEEPAAAGDAEDAQAAVEEAGGEEAAAAEEAGPAEETAGADGAEDNGMAAETNDAGEPDEAAAAADDAAEAAEAEAAAEPEAAAEEAQAEAGELEENDA